MRNAKRVYSPGGDGLAEVDVVRHLLNSHGYRMDGRQFDNRNRQVGHA